MIQGWFTRDNNWFQRSNLDIVYNKRCDYFSNIAADYFIIGFWEMLLHRQRSGRQRHVQCVGDGQGGKDDKDVVKIVVVVIAVSISGWRQVW